MKSININLKIETKITTQPVDIENMLSEALSKAVMEASQIIEGKKPLLSRVQCSNLILDKVDELNELLTESKKLGLDVILEHTNCESYTGETPLAVKISKQIFPDKRKAPSDSKFRVNQD